MKRSLFIILFFSVMACRSNKQEPETTIEPVLENDSPFKIQPLAAYNPESKLYVWKSNIDFSKTKNPDFNNGLLNVDSLIKGLNELNENVFLEKIKVSHDTIYTEVKNSEYLAEEIGSSGAEMYVADVVLNLTEVPGIKYVSISLQAGSHIEPGTWKKENFEKFKAVK